MNEKMTDEQLNVALAYTLDPYGPRLRAHIAALTDELDAIKAEMADECKAHMRLQEDARALRERVQALEAQCTKLAQERDAKWTTRRAAESRLAAIRATARTLQSMSLSTVMGGEWNRQASALIREIAGGDTHPLAPPEAFTHEKGLDAGVFEEAAKGCGLCPGCTDENWADGDLCDAATVRDMERTDYKSPPAMDVLSTPTATDPTTSEAFATAQGALHSFLGLIRIHYANRTECDGSMERGCLSGLGALSLLERRMGAQDKALRMVLKIAGEGSMFTQGERDALRFALTDAPLVFALGEVKEALTEHIGDLPAAVNEVVARLTALRK